MWNLFSDNENKNYNKKMDNFHNIGDKIELDDSEEAGNEFREEYSINNGVNANILNINTINWNRYIWS